MTDILRVPPHANDAEEAVIGGLLIDPAKLELIALNLAPDDFYRRDHGEIYRAILVLTGSGKTADAVTLGDAFPDIRDRAFELARQAYSSAMVSAYAKIIREKSVRRKLIAAAMALGDQAFGNEEPTNDLLASTIGSLMAMQKSESTSEYTLRQAMTMAYRGAQEARKRGGRIPGIATGFRKLDDLLGGWHDSDLIVVGARPSMGKTALLLKFAMEANVPCGIISAEQPAHQVGARVLSAHSHVPAFKFRNGAFEAEEVERLLASAKQLADYGCMIYDRSRPKLSDVVRMARKWKQQNGIRALFVDYVQRIEADHVGRNTPKNERVGEVAAGLKTLARDLEIPVIALGQVNRKVEERHDKRPHMADLSDSSEIEKEADEVLMLYREAVYYDKVNEDNKPVRENVAEINVEKNRHGPVGYIECAWMKETMRFEELTNEAA